MKCCVQIDESEKNEMLLICLTFKCIHPLSDEISVNI